MNENPYARYQVTRVQTASTGELVVLLYEGAVVFIRRAEADLAARRFDGVSDNLIHAQEIVLELNAGLDLVKGGPLAAALHELYLYLFQTLLSANTRKDPAEMALAGRLLTQLRDAWRTAVRGEEHPAIEAAYAVAGAA